MVPKYLVFILFFVPLSENTKVNFTSLSDFTCEAAKNELKNHPEMRTIAIIELENNFPSNLIREILKCLPSYVSKVITTSNIYFYQNSSIILPQTSMVIFIADKLEMRDLNFFNSEVLFSTSKSHFAKFLILTNNEEKIDNKLFEKLLNFASIYFKNGKIYIKNSKSKKFEISQCLNILENLYPEKIKNLNGRELNVVFSTNGDGKVTREGKLIHLWKDFADEIARKLNMTLNLIRISYNFYPEYHDTQKSDLQMLMKEDKLDLYINPMPEGDLEIYHFEDWCFVVPVPPKYSIYELILFLPLDKSCWMWLGITIAISGSVWLLFGIVERSEHHWKFIFGVYAYFVGQSVKIPSSRLTLKILLQILIFAIFIFSNGYQSLVTSFMLKPIQQKLLKTNEEIFNSDEVKIYIDKDTNETLWTKDSFQKALTKENKFVEFTLDTRTYQSLLRENNAAMLQPFKLFNNLLKLKGEKDNLDGFYQVRDVVVTLPTKMVTRPWNPLIGEFQKLIDIFFEAGIINAWENFFYLELNSLLTKNRKFLEEKNILEFLDIAPFFLILGAGFLLALFGYLLEIFNHDFLDNLSKDFCERQFWKIFKKKVKARKIRVKTFRAK